MKRFSGLLCAVIMVVPALTAQNLSRGEVGVSARMGFYIPTKGLRDGLMGSLEGYWKVPHDDVQCALLVELYSKRSADVFADVRPIIARQSFTLVPVSMNAGFRFLSWAHGMVEGWVGIGAGVSWHWYRVDYTPKTGSTAQVPETHTGFGGKLFGTIFSRVQAGHFVLEQRLYLEPDTERTEPGNHLYRFNPTGVAFSIGYYHSL